MHSKQQIHHFQDVHTGILSLAVLSLIHSIDGVSSVVISTDGRLLVSASWDYSIKVFDMHTRQQLHHFQKAHVGTIFLTISTLTLNLIDCIASLVISADSKFIVSASQDKSIKVFDMHTKQQLHHFQDAHTGNISLNKPSLILTFT